MDYNRNIYNITYNCGFGGILMEENNKLSRKELIEIVNIEYAKKIMQYVILTAQKKALDVIFLNN